MRLKKLIKILAVFALIIGATLVILLNNQTDTPGETPSGNEGINTSGKVDSSLQQVTDRNEFYAVKSCIEKFYSYYSDVFKNPTDGYLLEPETIDTEKIQKNRIEKVFKILDEEYLMFKSLTVENFTNTLPAIDDVTINIEKINVTKQTSDISVYFIYGKRIIDSTASDFSTIVKLDAKNKTFKILLDDYLENNYKDITLGQKINIQVNEIENEIYNIFAYENIDDQDYINDIFSHYKNILKTNKEQSYNLINETYKTLRFENLENYISYINENYSNVANAKMQTFSKVKSDNYTQYFVKDNQGNYYIFNETAPFEYTVMLDNYTVPTEQFKEEYNRSSNTEKVVLNIKRFFMGIDNQNYGYSYSVLSEGFKSNKYPTQNDFINYAKQNFFKNNKIEYVSYEKENNLYIYKIKVIDATGNSSEEKSFNIIMKLNSGTNFEMSFGTN